MGSVNSAEMMAVTITAVFNMYCKELVLTVLLVWFCCWFLFLYRTSCSPFWKGCFHLNVDSAMRTGRRTSGHFTMSLIKLWQLQVCSLCTSGVVLGEVLVLENPGEQNPQKLSMTPHSCYVWSLEVRKFSYRHCAWGYGVEWLTYWYRILFTDIHCVRGKK